MQKVEEYIQKHPNYSTILNNIRKVLLSANLEETIKWGVPTYMYNRKNIVGFSAFKAYCGLWFFQGALLKDTHEVLINAQEGTTKALRQWRFTEDDSIDEKLLLVYIKEAIDNEKKGLRIKPVKKPLIIPEELQQVLNANKKVKEMFNILSLSKKREFAEYIETAKKQKTKNSRLEKIIPMILNNIGLNDKYRNC